MSREAFVEAMRKAIRHPMYNKDGEGRDDFLARAYDALVEGVRLGKIVPAEGRCGRIFNNETDTAYVKCGRWLNHTGPHMEDESSPPPREAAGAAPRCLCGFPAEEHHSDGDGCSLFEPATPAPETAARSGCVHMRNNESDTGYDFCTLPKGHKGEHEFPSRPTWVF